MRRSNARYPRLPSSTHRACNESEEEQVEERIVEHDVMTMERHRTGTRHRRDALGDESQSRASASAFTLRLAKGSWVTSALVVLNAIVCVTLLVTYIDVESLKSVDYSNTLGTLVERLLKLGSEGDGIDSFDCIAVLIRGFNQHCLGQHCMSGGGSGQSAEHCLSRSHD